MLLPLSLLFGQSAMTYMPWEINGQQGWFMYAFFDIQLHADSHAL
jgi:hypothetical protein